MYRIHTRMDRIRIRGWFECRIRIRMNRSLTRMDRIRIRMYRIRTRMDRIRTRGWFECKQSNFDYLRINGKLK